MTPKAHSYNSRTQQRKTQFTSKPEQTATVCDFSASMEASFRKTVVAVGPMPPVAELVVSNQFSSEKMSQYS